MMPQTRQLHVAPQGLGLLFSAPLVPVQAAPDPEAAVQAERAFDRVQAEIGTATNRAVATAAIGQAPQAMPVEAP